MGSSIPFDEMVRMHRPLLLAIEIVAQSVGTNESFPRARVRVRDVIHGDLAPGEHIAVFGPSDGTMHDMMRATPAELATWNATPLSSPETGARLLVAANLQEGALVVWPASVRLDSEAERLRWAALVA